jgi:hypothetical protein
MPTLPDHTLMNALWIVAPTGATGDE